MAGPKKAAGHKRPAPGQGHGGPKKTSKPGQHHGKPAHGPAKPQQPAQPLSRKEQKEASVAKKVRFRRNFATIQEAVQLWERLRPKTTSKEDKQALVDQILGMFSGKVLELANQHTASRVIQFCLKEGGPDARAAISKEVRAHAAELARSKYGHYLVAKMINVAPREDVPELVALFKGRVAELLRHPQGADVLTDLYDAAPPALRNAMCAELYGREYALFEGVGGGAPLAAQVGHLRQLLEGAPPAKRKAVLQHLTRCMQPVLEKALLHPPMTHRLVRELLEAAPGSVVADTVDTLAATGGSVLKMVHTHDGAAAACMALAYGTPRDRKRLIKGMKGYVWQMAENEWGYAVLATALTVVDDTSLTGKTLVSDIKSKIGDYISHRHARRALLQLLSPDDGRYLPPSALQLIHPPRRTVMEAAAKGGAGGGGDSDEEPEEGPAGKQQQKQKQQQQQKQRNGGGKGQQQQQQQQEEEEEEEGGKQEGNEEQQLVERVLGESKKDPTLRRRELLGTGKDCLGAALTRAVSEAAPALLRDQWGADVAVEVARGAAGGLLWDSQREGVEAVHAAIVAEVSRLPPAAAAAAGGKQQQQKGGGKKRKQQQQQEEEEGERQQNGGGGGSDEEGEGQEEGEEPLFTNYFASRALRRLLLASAEPGGDAARAFARALWSEALSGGRCRRWVGSHADKVLAALVVCGDKEVAAEAAAELGPLVGGDAAAWAATHGGGGPGGGEKRPQQQQQQQQQQQARKKAKRKD